MVFVDHAVIHSGNLSLTHSFMH